MWPIYVFLNNGKMDIKKESELRVLRHLEEKSVEMIPKGMDEHEFNAACYRLEKKNYVKLARIEGGFEAIRMLDEGFVHLKELEMEEKEDRDEIERLRNENAELKALSRNKQYVIFEKTQKFVEDTQYFCTIITSPEFYDSNGSFYRQTKRRFDSYCEVNVDELVKEVNNSPLQTYFNDYKKLLNSIDIPNKDLLSMSMYIQDNLTKNRDLLEDAVEIFETVIDRCGDLRNSLENFMSLYDLKDNFPKKGFLRPLFIDVEITKDIKEKHSSLKTEKNKMGRPRARSFEFYIKRDAPPCFLNILNNMLQKKTGRAAAQIIIACIGYWIDKPEIMSVVNKFESVKKTSFSTAINNKSNFLDDKITSIREEITRKIKENSSK